MLHINLNLGRRITIKGGRWDKLSLLLPLLLTGILYLGTTTGRAVIDYDEGYYAQAAKHMVEHRDWVTPYANGVRFLEKPPLLYWLTAASFSVFGINEFALRLPTALAVIALVWIVMRTARRAFNERGCFNRGVVRRLFGWDISFYARDAARYLAGVVHYPGYACLLRVVFRSAASVAACADLFHGDRGRHDVQKPDRSSVPRRDYRLVLPDLPRVAQVGRDALAFGAPCCSFC